MQAVLYVVFSVQLAIGPLVCGADVIRFLSSDTPVVELSTFETVTLTDQNTGETVEIVILDIDPFESTAMNLFDTVSDALVPSGR